MASGPAFEGFLSLSRPCRVNNMRSALPITTLLLLAFWIQVVRSSAEADLIRNLMTNYTRDSRPVHNSSSPININITLSLSHILELDEKRELFNWVVWIRQEWMDEYLVWNPDDYEAIDVVHLNMDRIWSPDLYIYNLVGESVNVATSFLGTGREIGLVQHSGHIINFMPVRLETICKVDLLYFPFDTQTCQLSIGSWAYSERSLVYHLGGEPVNMLSEESGSAWSLKEITQQRHSSLYVDINDSYSVVDFYVTIARNPLFYLLNMLIPSYLLSGVMLMSVFLPPGCGERMSVGLTVFMSYSVYTLIISSIVPDSSKNPPLICILLIINMILTLLTISWTVFVIRVEYASATWGPPPAWTTYFQIICKIPVPRKCQAPTSGSPKWQPKDGSRAPHLLTEAERRQQEGCVVMETDVGAEKPRDVTSIVQGTGGDVLRRSGGEKSYRPEWQAIARVGDRIVAIIYITVTVSGLLILWAWTR